MKLSNAQLSSTCEINDLKHHVYESQLSIRVASSTMNLADETLDREGIFTHKIQSEDFKYFYPDLYNKDDMPIMILDEKTYYQDLIQFIEKIQDAARHFEK